MENGTHLSGDLSLLKAKRYIRSGRGLENNAALNNLVLAAIKRGGKFATVLEGMTHCTANREAAHAPGQPSKLVAALSAGRSERVPQGIQNPSENQIDLRYCRRPISVFGFTLHHSCLVHERLCVSLSQAAE